MRNLLPALLGCALFFAPGAKAQTASTAPVATNDQVFDASKTAITIDVLKNDTFTNGPLTIQTLSTPSSGTATINGAAGSQTILYTPSSSFAGFDKFTYSVKDADGNTSNLATVTILSGPPKAVADAINLNFVHTATVHPLLNDVIASADKTTITSFTQGKLGTVTIGDSKTSLTYHAGAGFSTFDSFTYTITDSVGLTSTATVSVIGGNLTASVSGGAVLRDTSGQIVGYVQIYALGSRAFTGKMEAHGKKYRLLGSFNSNDQYIGFATEEGGAKMAVALEFTQQTGGLSLSARLPDGTVGIQDFGTLTNAGLVAAQGRYTVVLPAAEPSATDATTTDSTNTDTSTVNGGTQVTVGNTGIVLNRVGSTPDFSSLFDGSSTTTTSTATNKTIPQGMGWMSIKVDYKGRVGIKGKAGDGRKFGAKGFVAGTDDAPSVVLYVTPRSSIIAGTLSLAAQVADDTATTTTTDTTGTTPITEVSGTLSWTRPPSGSDFYPDGFDLILNATGARYVEPPSDRRGIPEFSTFSATDGGLGDLTTNVRFRKDDHAEEPNPSDDGLTITYHRSSGIFSGAFTAPNNSGKHVHFDGVILQGSSNGGAGVFQGEKKAGMVTLKATSSGSSSTNSGSTTSTNTTDTSSTTTGN